MESNPSQFVVSDPGFSVSQRVQAVNSSPVPHVCRSTAAVDVDEDWPVEWCYDWESDWMEDWREDWDDEGSCLVCGVAGSNPSQKQQNNEIVLLMIDSGSQSTTCCVD